MANITYEEKIATEKRIKEAAREVIAEKGVQKASIREIAKRAGVGASTVYGYFPSKPLLFIETILPSIESQKLMSDTLEEIDFSSATFEDIVDQLAEAIFYIPISIHNFDRKVIREIHLLMFSESSSREDIKKRMESFMESKIQLILTNFFQRMADEGRLKVEIEPLELASILLDYMRLVFIEYIVILAATKEDSIKKLRNSIRLILLGKI